MSTKLAAIVSLKKGSYIVIDGVACRTTDTQVSRPGKHGHAKVRLTASGIFDGKKRIIMLPGHDNVEVPIIEKKSAQVLSITGKVASVMDTETYETFDLAINDEVDGEPTEGCNVLYWEVLGEKVMKQVKSE